MRSRAAETEHRVDRLQDRLAELSERRTSDVFERFQVSTIIANRSNAVSPNRRQIVFTACHEIIIDTANKTRRNNTCMLVLRTNVFTYHCATGNIRNSIKNEINKGFYLTILVEMQVGQMKGLFLS